MYGIVNQAIQGLVQEQFGHDQWTEIKKRSGVEHDFFLSDQAYDDDITFNLVHASSEVLGISASEVLESFGQYWVLRTGQEKYGQLMKAGGYNFSDFIRNLPNFHSRIMLFYPKLNPPEFRVEEPEEHVFLLHYYSSRSGLTFFVVGLIKGIAIMFNNSIEIEHLSNEQQLAWHDVFRIKLIP